MKKKEFFNKIILVSIFFVILGGIFSFQHVQALGEESVDNIQLQFQYPGGITKGAGAMVCSNDENKICELDDDQNPNCEPGGFCVPSKILLNTEETQTPGNALYVFLNNFYKLAIVIAAMAAVLMLVVGGYKWIFAGGNSSVVDSAKKTIKGAILGLVIALLSYSILGIVNPDTLNISISDHLTPIEKAKQDLNMAELYALLPEEADISESLTSYLETYHQSGPLTLCTESERFVEALKTKIKESKDERITVAIIATGCDVVSQEDDTCEMAFSYSGLPAVVDELTTRGEEPIDIISGVCGYGPFPCRFCEPGRINR